MQLALEQSVDVLVLPELVVDPDSVEGLRALIRGRRLSLVIPGSAHLESEGGLRNRAPALDGSGTNLFSHDKAGRFSLKAHHWAALCQQEGLVVPDTHMALGALEHLHEAITPGRELSILDDGRARFAVNICADLLDSGAQFRRLVEETQIELLLLPSYSTEVKPFFQAAEELRYHRVAVFYINAGAVAARTSPPTAAFVSLPIHQRSLPSTLSWDGGGHLWEGLEAEKRVPWTHPHAAWLLPEQRGLIVDLGAWMAEPTRSE